MQITLKDVVVRYDKHANPVITGLSLEYETPQTLCLLGNNGCGKSTLLKTLIGHLVPLRGSLMLDGQEIRKIPPKKRAQLIAYVAQAHHMTFPFTCLEVATFGRTAYLSLGRGPRDEDVHKALAALERVGVKYLADKPFTEISGGEQQLVMLASALAQEAQLLLLDEPTSHLDYGNQYRLLEILKEIADDKTGIIMTTHYPDHALRLGGDTAYMRNGKIELRGPSETVITEENLTRLYHRTVRVKEVEGRKVVLT